MWNYGVPDIPCGEVSWYGREQSFTMPSRGVLAVDDPEEQADEKEVLVCRFCGKHITDISRQISVNGLHFHTFANPYGIVYGIGCFQSAIGCRGSGPSSDDFSWFSGYDWQVVICAGCATHMGWLFSSRGGDCFFGLILDHLVGSG